MTSIWILFLSKYEFPSPKRPSSTCASASWSQLSDPSVFQWVPPPPFRSRRGTACFQLDVSPQGSVDFPALCLLSSSWALLLWCLWLRLYSTTDSSFPWVPTAATSLNCIVLKALALGRMRKEPNDENKTFHRVPMDTPCHQEAHTEWGWVTQPLKASPAGHLLWASQKNHRIWCLQSHH